MSCQDIVITASIQLYVKKKLQIKNQYKHYLKVVVKSIDLVYICEK